MVVLLVASVLLACSSRRERKRAETAETEAARPADRSAEVFDPLRLLAIDITLTAGDWEILRHQGRDLSALATECQSAPRKVYSYFRAKVTIDGETFEGVGVRKKGYLGSLSVLRPSLKLKFDEFNKSQRYRGLRRLTLNNNKQDPSLIRTCLTYKIFRDAGAPAPRCNFARVTVNGMRLGIYSNVETIKKPFLRRHFADDKGDLLEGLYADFGPGWQDAFQSKNRKAVNAREKVADVIAALSRPDEEVVAALSAVVEYDQFLTFWAAETLSGHWDSYSNNRNNYFLYREATSGKFHFIPWGPDLGFSDFGPFHLEGRPSSVSAESALARRLYGNAGVRADYVARMRELLSKVWDERALLAEVDRLDALLEGAPNDSAITQIKRFILGRKKQIVPELDAGGGDWQLPAYTSACWPAGGAITGTFSTSYGILNLGKAMGQGTARLTLPLGGKRVELSPLGVAAGVHPGTTIPEVWFIGRSGGSIYAIKLVFEPLLFDSGVTLKFHGLATYGVVFEVVDGGRLQHRGLISSGSVTLDEAERATGAMVRGSFSGTVYEGPPPTAPVAQPH
jgi:hypothetical protein